MRFAILAALLIWLAAPPAPGQVRAFQGMEFALMLEGPAREGGFGYDLACGDFDADGIADLAISAPGADQLYFLPGSKERLEPGSMRGYRDAFRSVSGPPGTLFGFAVAAADYDEDGFAEVLVGAPLGGLPATPRGEAYLVEEDGWQSHDRQSGEMSRAATSVAVGRRPILSGETNGDGLGYSVAFADLNGDGRLDVAAGAPRSRVSSLDEAGRVHLRLGMEGGFDEQVAAAAGHRAGQHFGAALGVLRSSAGPLLAVGAPASRDLPGQVHVLDSAAITDSQQSPLRVLEGDTGFGSGIFPLADGKLGIGNPLGHRLQVVALSRDGREERRSTIYSESPVEGVTHASSSLGWALIEWQTGGRKAVGIAGLPQSNKVVFLQLDHQMSRVGLSASIILELSLPFHDVQVVQSPDAYGHQLCLCDVDADGIDDLVVSAPGLPGRLDHSEGTGVVFVYSGRQLAKVLEIGGI